MINQKRLTRIETAITPKQAVLLWLRQEFQGKTMQELVRWLSERPVAAAPRIRVERQVVGAIETAMKGQDPARIRQAAREAQMATDLLILLVSRTKLCGSGSDPLRLAPDRIIPDAVLQRSFAE